MIYSTTHSDMVRVYKQFSYAESTIYLPQQPPPPSTVIDISELFIFRIPLASPEEKAQIKGYYCCQGNLLGNFL